MLYLSRQQSKQSQYNKRTKYLHQLIWIFISCTTFFILNNFSGRNETLLRKIDRNTIEAVTPLSTKAGIEEFIAIHGQNMSKSNQILFDILKLHVQQPLDEFIDTAEKEKEEIERCARYGLDFNLTEIGGKRRRIFFGSLIADDSWHPIGTHAIEAHGLYHTIAFIESNTTQTLTHRETRFVDGDNPTKKKNLRRKAVASIFGEKSNVVFDYFDGNWKDEDEKEKIHELAFENAQRHRILKIWKEDGMTEEDIGIISDVDEMFSRDFLLASQTCDIPQFRQGQDCKAPKIVAAARTFESSPNCVKNRLWYHPDAIIGQCIEGIGNSETLHTIPAIREFKDFGCRPKDQGKSLKDYNVAPLNQTNWTQYPLWNAADFRCVEGGEQYKEIGHVSKTHVAFHFHNFFDSAEILRNKYKTYGHPISNADKAPLESFQDGLITAVGCAMNRVVNLTHLNGGKLENMPGRRPILYNNVTYIRARHEEVEKMFKADELKHKVHHTY